MIIATIISSIRAARRYFLFGLLILGCAITASAQHSSTDGYTPLALAPGAPAGSSALSDVEHVNAYNGHLSASVPLVQIGGRGGAGIGITAKVDTTPFRVLQTTTQDGPDPYGIYHFLYAPDSDWWNPTPG